jgi:tRNA-specific 2-thiouridylase
VVGAHLGREMLTIGQRARIGGCEEAYFVLSKELPDSPGDVWVVRGREHPALFTRGLSLPLSRFSWIDERPLPVQLSAFQRREVRCWFKLRSTQVPEECSVLISSESLYAREEEPSFQYYSALKAGKDSREVVNVTFDRPQRAVAHGQILVLYFGDTCLGGGII